jgi:DNA-directed RNA polymerase specialized sigma24 family protein
MVRAKTEDGELVDKLDLIARLLAYLVAAEHDTLERRAMTLSALGLPLSEIARVCNSTAKSISVRLAEARRKTGWKSPERARKSSRKG